jgi:hypothetical protein
MLKLIMTWDIRPGRESEYFDWAIRTFVPGLMELGLQPIDAWYTVHGNAPQMLTGVLADDRQSLERALSSVRWQELHDQLLTFVTNYQQKIVKATSYSLF